MQALPILFSALAVLLFLFAAGLLYCFLRIFYSFRKKEEPADSIPKGKIYDTHREQILTWIKDSRTLPRREVSIRSHDGLLLRGYYYEYKKGAPIEILIHGYRGSGERDMSGGIFRCFSLGHSALVIDHRASGRSEGHVITFGDKEALDCLRWVDFTVNEIDPDARIILTGISMGAATVMNMASMPLPKNVVGILADCGYTSTREIIEKVMRDLHLPDKLLYPFARLSARIFGGFDPNNGSPIESMKRCQLPIIFIHGDEDDFVPCSMSVRNHEACASEKKRLVIIPHASHALCYPTDKETYVRALREFFEE